MKVTGVRVEISKRVSDGDYGFEQYQAQYVAELEEGEDADAAIRELSQRGRAEIVAQLGESSSPGVRYRIAPPKNVTPALREAMEATPEGPECPNHDACALDDDGHCSTCGQDFDPDDLPF